MVNEKAKEFASLTLKELHERLDELRAELFKLRFQNRTGSLENYRRIPEVKKDIARAKTFINQKQSEQQTAGEAE